ncbi:helix-turn-helix transcriptional regulator [Oscillibacter sp.]|uniref:PadR family transcriptional regulator n=1 Tax=Oscillibacter sp. TaxID=1945593 RepID=UPI0028A8E6BA|nr:helix-turn-helix transcriptional regulator [Oscillibacter sp.]
MAREKFQTLTEQMFYILLSLRKELCGADVMARVAELTDGRVMIGPGTLYNLLDSFLNAEMIEETAVEGRRRSYQITSAGEQALLAEANRMETLLADYQRLGKEGGSA